jgi:NSS family neurotransmitter:Na+ symporter
MAWSVMYGYFSLSDKWGSNPTSFFYNGFLGLTEGPFSFGKIQTTVLIGLVICWIMIVFSIRKGAKTVGKVVYATVILPWILLIVFVIRGVTLPGAAIGLTYYRNPVFSKLLDPSVWTAAYGQVFYSVSLGLGILIAYSSFLPEKADITSSAIIIGISDALTAFVGGLAVFV